MSSTAQRRKRNMIKFLLFELLPAVLGPVGIIYLSGERDPLRILGAIAVGLMIRALVVNFWTLFVVKPKHPKSYGDWAVITGTTSGIGEAFAHAFAKRGLNIFLISRSEEKLIAQQKTMQELYPGMEFKYLPYNFADMSASSQFYAKLAEQLATLHGGIGILVNNVGFANMDPVLFEEMTDEYFTEMVNTNCLSTLRMTQTVLPFMKARQKGLVLSISSGSINQPTCGLAVYSATKSFMAQFSHTLTYELEKYDIDCQVLTPYLVVSNLVRGKSSTWIVPFASEWVESVLKHLGKKSMPVYAGWSAHTMLTLISKYYWDTPRRLRNIMTNNRERAEARKAKAS